MCYYVYLLRKFFYNFILYYCILVIIRWGGGGILCKYYKIYVICLFDNKIVLEIFLFICKFFF